MNFTLSSIWGRVRRFVPLWAYPLLAPVYRARRRKHLRALAADDARFRAAHPGKTFPPAELRYNVVGPCTVEQFRETGLQTLKDIQTALTTVGAALHARDVLDFGCGCGRLAGAIIETDAAVSYVGCDVDARAIAWCQAHLTPHRFLATTDRPPLPFAAGSFDVIWCGSVFTHLDEERQFVWLDELARLLRPGGVLLASVHGRESWRERLPSWAKAKLEKSGFLYARTNVDAGVHPDWYQVAWHTEAYVRRHWARFFDVRGYLPRGFNNHQDIVVCRSIV
jgi:SAM-dependent methyltransferase